MTNIKLPENLKAILGPVLLLSLLLSMSSFLLLQGKNFILNTIDYHQIPFLKILAIFPKIIFVLVLLIISKYQSFEKIFKYTLLTLSGIVSLLLGLMVFHDQLALQNITTILEKILPETTVQMHYPLLSNWTTTLFYIVVDLINFNLVSLFIWGFINRLTNTSEGIKYYLPLALILGTMEGLISNFGPAWLDSINWPLTAYALFAVAFMICAVMIFNWRWKKLPSNLLFPKESLPNLQNRFPYLSAAFLLAGCLMIKSLLEMLLKSESRMQFSDPKSYFVFMKHYSTAAGSFTILISILWVVLGSWLLRKKSVRTMATYGAVSLLAGGFIYLSSTAITNATSWATHGIYSALLTGTYSALFFPLIQIIYLYFPHQKRFRNKIITEMCALPLMESIPSLAIQGLIMFGGFAFISVYCKILTVIFMGLLVFASNKLSPPMLVARRHV